MIAENILPFKKKERPGKIIAISVVMVLFCLYFGHKKAWLVTITRNRGSRSPVHKVKYAHAYRERSALLPVDLKFRLFGLQDFQLNAFMNYCFIFFITYVIIWNYNF